MAKKPIYKSLYFQVIVAIIAGILVGHFSPSGTQIVNGAEQYVPGLGEQLKPLGDAFIRLIKMKAIIAAKAPPAFSFAHEPPMAAANKR